MKLDVLVKASQNGALEMLENATGLTGAAKMALRRDLDAIYKEVEAFDKEKKKIINDATNGSNSIDKTNPRFAAVVATLDEMLQVEAKYEPVGVFLRSYVDEMPISVGHTRSVEDLGLILEEGQKPNVPKAPAKGAHGKAHR